MNKLLTAAAMILALGATGALAQTVVADTDGDAVFSMEELVAAYPDLTPEIFTEMDVDASGSIDADELQAAREQGLIAA